MKKNKITIIMIAVLVLLTAILTVAHLTTRQQEQEGAVQVVRDGKTTLMYIEDFKPVARVQGTITNNKGEESSIDAPGIMMIDLLALAGEKEAERVQVIAVDEYSAVVTAEEIAEEGKVWLLIEEDALRLIVFGDQGSKRNVRDVVRLVVD